MTLAAAWVRHVSTLRQLVVIADSRGTGGEIWDWCPKVIPLPRPATIGAVAGDLALGYAYLIQAVSATALDEGNRSGRVDIGNFASQVDRLLKPARSPTHLTDLPRDGDINEAELLIGGWSWRRSRFEAFKFSRDRRGDMQKQDIFRGGLAVDGVHFFGSGAASARDRLATRLEALKHSQHVQWEPLEILLELSADPGEREVGGAPQVVVANQHGLTDQFLTPWPASGNELWIGGRPLGHQRSDLRALRFITNQQGRFDVEPYFPAGLSIASAEILRAQQAASESEVPAGPEYDSVGELADQLSQRRREAEDDPATT